MKALEDSVSVPVEDSGVVLASLSRIPKLWDIRWSEGRIYWKVDVPRGDEAAAHLAVRRIVDRALSTHRVVHDSNCPPALRSGS